MTASLFDLKAQLRVAARRTRDDAAARGQIGPALAANIESAITIPPTAVVSGFWPIGSEVDILPALARYSARGSAIALPVVIERGAPLAFRRWRDGDDMDAGPFGIAEPKLAAGALSPDVLFVPMLSFSRAGFRLGYGGGFYDRTLRGLRAQKSIVAIGVAFAVQENPETPHGPDDEQLDWIVTEREAFKIVTV